MKNPHAILRAQDRYGIDLTVDDLNTITQLIQSNHGEFIRQDSDKKTHWWLEYKGIRLRLLISADFYTVITVLPPFEKSRKPRPCAKKIRRKKIYDRGHARYKETHA